jgi:hypothetical protein
MNQVNEVFDPKKASCREMSIEELQQVVLSNFFLRAGAWGFRNPCIVVKNKCYRFRVSGMIHKGYVYIILNGLDLFDIYYTNIKDVIKKISTDVYVMDLVDTIDRDVEKIPEYRR